MSLLLMRLAGPLQSWGTQSRFGHRDTGTEPSRSGVVGLLCAALGRPRDEPLDDFLPLVMAVRVDREGTVLRDYHTAQQVRRADASKSPQETVLSERFYLADADFLVGLAGDAAFLATLDAALRQPVWPLALGRKACVPSLPLALGVVEGDLLETMKRYPRCVRVGERPREALRYVTEVPHGTGEARADVPLSFVSRDRRFAVRHVRVEFHPWNPPEALPCT